MYFDAEKILFGMRERQGGQGIAHAETNLQHPGGAAPEQPVEIECGADTLDTVVLPEAAQRFALGSGDASLPQYKTTHRFVMFVGQLHEVYYSGSKRQNVANRNSNKENIMRLLSVVVLGLCVGLVAPVQAGYEEGRVAYQAKSYEKALKEFRAAAARKNAAAEYMLGMMYAKGEGVPADDKRAAEWLRKGAEHGNADAQLNYGLIHLQGRAVSQSNEEAIKCYRKAASQSHAVAQYALTVTPNGV